MMSRQVGESFWPFAGSRRDSSPAFLPSQTPMYLLYLLYLDESYRGKSDPFVVGGFAIHEQDAWFLSQRVEQLSDRISNQGRGAEFHASPMRRGKGEWHTVPQSERTSITNELAQILTEDLLCCSRLPWIAPPFPIMILHTRGPMKSSLPDAMASWDGWRNVANAIAAFRFRTRGNLEFSLQRA